MLRIGDSYQEEITFTQEMEQKFIDITGDNNPIHTDANAALNKGGGILRRLFTACWQLLCLVRCWVLHSLAKALSTLKEVLFLCDLFLLVKLIQ